MNRSPLLLPLMTSVLRRLLDLSDRVPAQDPFASDQWVAAEDPGDHPALRGLSPRELADLPFPRSAGQAGGDGLGRKEPQTSESNDLRPAA